MKNKRLALLLAAALTVTSADSAVIAVSAADFSSEAAVVEEDTEEAQAADEEISADSAEAQSTSEAGDEVDISSDDTEENASDDTAADEETEVEDGSEELFSDQAGDGETNASFIPDDTQNLELDKDYTVNVDADHPRGWFSFTPEESGQYIFSSTNNTGLDPIVYLFDKKDVKSEWDYLSWADEGKGGNGDFLLRYELEKGVTYYYDARLIDMSISGSFTVNLTKVKELSSISASGMKTTLIAGFDTLRDMLSGVKFTLQYDGAPETHEFDSNGGGALTDPYGHYIFPMLIQNGEKVNFDYDSCVDEGTYSYCFSDDDWFDPLFSEAYSVEAIPVTKSDAYIGDVKEGANSISIKSGDIVSFVPERDGRYSFSSSESGAMNVAIKNIRSGVYIDASALNGYCSLEEGKTYYIRNNGDDVSDMTIKEVPEVVSVKFDASEMKTKFLAYKEFVYASGLKLTVNYNNGVQPKTFTFDKETKFVDEYGNEFSYCFAYGMEGSYDYEEYIPGAWAGNSTHSYELKITRNGSKIATGISAVFSSDPEGAVPELKLGSNAIKSPSDSQSWYWFSPEESGKYSFGPAKEISISKKTEYWEDTVYGSSEGDTYICMLEKDAVYYVGLSGSRTVNEGEDINAWDLSVEKLPDLQTIIPTVKELNYVAGLDDLNAASMVATEKLTLTYDKDGVTETQEVMPYFGYTAAGKYGCSIATYILDADGNEFDIRNCDSLPVGTYKFIFYCDEIESEPVTVNVTAFDYDSVPKLTADGKNTIEVKKDMEDQNSWYALETGDHPYWAFAQMGTDSYPASMRWKKVDADGNIEDMEIQKDKSVAYWTLDKDSKYLVSLHSDGAYEGDYWVFPVSGGSTETPCEWAEVERREPTCTSAGETFNICRVHGENETHILEALGHTPGKWKVAKEATALAEGRQEQRCTVCNTVIATKKIAKLKATVKLNVSGTLPLKVKQTFQLKASGLAKGDAVSSWKSSNTKVVTVSSNGKLTGKKDGKATITVKLKSGLTSKITVKVQKTDVAATSVAILNKTTGKKLSGTVSLKAKKKLTLSASVAPVTCKQKVTYSSSNKKIATVSSKGVVTAVKKGTVTITVKAGKKTAKIKIKVK